MTSPPLDDLFEDLGEPDARRDLSVLLDDAQIEQIEANMRHARRAARVAEVFHLARRHPELYTDLPGDNGIEAAERAAALDLSVRLSMSENQARTLGYIAETAQAALPWLWQRARDGHAQIALVEATVQALVRVQAPTGSSQDERAAAAKRVRAVDEATSEWAVRCTPAAFRARLARLIDKLDPASMPVRHTRALRDRRVMVEQDRDGMSWLTTYLPTTEATAIFRRLTSAAKHLAKDAREQRTRDQLRSDLLACWLRGDGQPAAVKTKVFVTVPVTLLSGASPADGRCAGCGGSGWAAQAEVVGQGQIDPDTARRMLLDAGVFTRVITDPVTGGVIDMERRSRRATRLQREWLILAHGTCTRDGCTRHAADGEIDHEQEWARGGRTDLAGLRPLCALDHRIRHTTRMRYRSRADGTVEVATPTGFTTAPRPPDPPPPF